MKKFVVIFLLLVMMSTVVYAGTFDDTSGMECEFAIDRLYFMGIVNGTGNNKFEPQKTVTRAELSKMIINVLASENENGNKTFSDIEGHWGKEYILKAANLGILNGYLDGTFRPDKEVSYAEAIAIILRCMGYSDLEDSEALVWYENYIKMMEEIGLDNNLGGFSPETLASRGDIAIILWNMVSSDFCVKDINDDSYTYEDNSILKSRFGSLNYFDDVKVTNITSYNGNVVYVTSKGNFYVENNIDFSDLGGDASGFYDSTYNVLIGMKIDENRNYTKVSGSLKSISEMGYEVLSCKNISGFGDKVYAEYVEVFLDRSTGEVMRVVFYDTRNSHFAEQIKIGDTRVTIESKDVYDQSIVQLKNGKMITYNILRTESVMDIPKSALLVHDGEVTSWTSVPANSSIREIVKDCIYAYVNTYIDGKIKTGKVNMRSLKINGVEYYVSDECICQNVVTKETMKLKESLTSDDINAIRENGEKVRVYLNEFDEIVKLEFTLDVWGLNELEEKKEEYKSFEKFLENVGFVTDVNIYNETDNKSSKKSISVLSAPGKKYKEYSSSSSKTDFKIGDLVYLPSGETTAIKLVPEKLKVDDFEIVLNYSYPIDVSNRKIGIYYFDDDSQIIEVTLQKSETKDGEYSKCTLKEKVLYELGDYTRYKNMSLVLDGDGKVIRLYAVKEIGKSLNIGVVKDIKVTASGDSILKTNVYLINEKKNTKKYSSVPVMGYGIGDLITFEVKARAKDEKEDGIIVDEVYRHENIGSSYDLIVKKYSDGEITFKNSDMVFDLNKQFFEYDGKTYDFDDYTFVNVDVEKDKETSEWLFTNFKVTNNKNSFKVMANVRIAVNEITGTIIAYEGYKE